MTDVVTAAAAETRPVDVELATVDAGARGEPVLSWLSVAAAPVEPVELALETVEAVRPFTPTLALAPRLPLLLTDVRGLFVAARLVVLESVVVAGRLPPLEDTVLAGDV